MHAVTFDASGKSHAPTDLELPMLVMDASDFLDYRKSVEYVFQSHGVKQYLTETDAGQLVSSWSEAFCARLHASIAKSMILHINEQLKNERSKEAICLDLGVIWGTSKLANVMAPTLSSKIVLCIAFM
jgi:hypothetical protein